ncbi:hypothetical protein AUR04nite_33200 [Glutamicibacter uratoxydans]|uniref:DUF4352 domain-containing protein n=1 Tax=Glutamicibacter uratoxydans TaxID=43667 RepID=A0A4Y4DWM6_GLUUR|nr:membrane lipoprotein lipid attachment site-containing protein [Glutamicibacter uratoxydans]GED07788.1 hypothetical protein AUR04nite_33200 [Glutamicibacter uratoxydans]
MKKIFPIAFVAALVLTGCSTGQNPNDQPTESTLSAPSLTIPEATDSTSTTSTVESSSTASALGPVQTESVRGNLIKQVGDLAGISNENGEPILEFTINRMTIDPKCTGRWKEKAENGHLVLLEVSAKTYKSVDDVNSNGWDLNPYGFKIIKKDGTTSNAPAGSNASFSCFNENKYLPTMGDAEKASGYVVLDVEDPSGTLVYEEGYTGVGWEWEYPAK